MEKLEALLSPSLRPGKPVPKAPIKYGVPRMKLSCTLETGFAKWLGRGRLATGTNGRFAFFAPTDALGSEGQSMNAGIAR